MTEREIVKKFPHATERIGETKTNERLANWQEYSDLKHYLQKCATMIRALWWASGILESDLEDENVDPDGGYWSLFFDKMATNTERLEELHGILNKPNGVPEPVVDDVEGV